MPFVAGLVDRGARVCAYTQNGLKTRTLLNLLWYRLCKRFKRDFMVLSDGRVFSTNPIFSYIQRPEGAGIAYHEVPAKLLVTKEQTPPRPSELSVEEYVVITEANRDGEIDITNMEHLVRVLEDARPHVLQLCQLVGLPLPRRLEWRSYPQLLKGLMSSGFLARDGNTLRLTTTRLNVQVTAAGIVGFDNRDGAFNAILPNGFLQYLRQTPYDYAVNNAFVITDGASPVRFAKIDLEQTDRGSGR